MVAPAPTRRKRSASEEIGALRRRRLAEARLYFVCDARPHGEGPEPLLRGALSGGAQMVQLRDKSADDDAILRAAEAFRRLADEHDALFILNDRPDLIGTTGADGVHLGQDDTDPTTARDLLGPDTLIGISTHSREQLAAASAGGLADYASVGPVWETPTKEGRPAVGLDLVRHAAETAALPFFAIGGIDAGNVREVVEAGATRVVVVRAIRDSTDPRAAAEALLGELDATP
jgi:thiamine-phosphate pyrophosphorylase